MPGPGVTATSSAAARISRKVSKPGIAHLVIPVNDQQSGHVSTRPLQARHGRDRTTFPGSDARNSTTQTQSSTMSLKMNSPVRFQAIGSVDRLHLTTPGVVKKNDHVMAKVTTPISDPIADSSGLNAPAASSAAITSSATPST